ncbi:hypothetical protein [Desulfovibrio cuneatus]|uniref:hypothetical protein n=1 Tax=Desulfovibrio cuneatus TaxID=159728 RepID=UPI0006861F36|nr:hypothetical protein [Desulfovibrio cuneatus]
MMKNAQEFERQFILAVDERVEKSGLTHSNFGRKVFGEVSGERLWRKCRDVKNPRKISFAESYAMATLLGIDYPSFVWQVGQRVLQEDVVGVKQ